MQYLLNNNSICQLTSFVVSKLDRCLFGTKLLKWDVTTQLIIDGKKNPNKSDQILCIATAVQCLCSWTESIAI